MEHATILVAEDEAIVAGDLCDTVEEAGHIVEGPHADMPSAMLAFQKHRPDLAILDVQLGSTVVYPLAEKLAAENIPIIFHSGRHSCADMQDRFPQATALAKPCPPNELIDSVSAALSH